MDNSDTVCIFCGNELADDIVAVEKGLEKISQVSLQLNDGLCEKLREKKRINVHKSCRQKYTRPSTIRAAERAEKESCETAPSTSSVLRSSERKFDFKTDCLICGKTATISSKYPQHRRKSVHLVSTLEIRENIIGKCNERCDDLGERVKCRLANVSDLVAPEARYHGNCYRNFLKSAPLKDTPGRPKSKLSQAFNKLCEFIENSDECQYTIQELLSIMNGFSGLQETYSEKHFKQLLKNHFKDRLLFSNITGRVNIVCSSRTANKLIDRLHVFNRDPAAERMRIIIAAADIIKEDIQKMQYDSNKYPSVENIRSGGENLVPDSLKSFTDRVTKKKNASDRNKTSRKCAVINHAIISAVRPRSFLSPIQIGIGLTLHRLYGSKHLIDLLAAMGVCVSYNEVSVYMNSLINAGSPKISEEAFIQYVFDNADVNIRTLDGLNTFHAMGGIKCIAPSTCAEAEIEIKRISSGTFNPEIIPVLSYGKRNRRSGLANILVEDMNHLKTARGVTSERHHAMFPLNVMWLAASHIQPGWNGFMTSVMSTKEKCETTYILGVPFVNLDPTNPSTIFSVLSFASEQCKKRNRACIVTFDQPLFLKSSEIVASAESTSDISKIILRLGGFHLLMSFMGSVGKIMEGSGLEAMWASVYGQTTVNHMMHGHAYARCIRAYSLTACAIINVMREHFPEVKRSLQILETFSIQLVGNERNEQDVLEESEVVDALKQINAFLKNIQSVSRTTKLWVNLLKCIDLIMRFIFAERSGDWDLHLNTTIEMLPYLHAAGHLPYAKSAHLYIQQMNKIESKLSEQELAYFKEKGFFTVRRKGVYWSGTWTDMCIEQGLMRPMKSIGGLTHGRGITDSTLSKWVLGTPFFLKVNEAIEDFLGTSIQYNEQHVELRESRKERDLCDLLKFTSWLQQHNPFTKLSGELVSLESGFVCDDSVNCDRAYDIGLIAIDKMKGKNFEELKLHRKDMVKTQAQQKSIKVRSKEVVVNSQQLFNRILCVCDSPGKLKFYLEYELSARPPSIFDDISLRKGTKSSVMKMFQEGIVEKFDMNDCTYVLDGGFLLHRVTWPKNCTYGDILENYRRYILSQYGSNTIVVFDGYPVEPTTKNEEQTRRAARHSSCDIEFEKNTICVTAKEDFLGNKTNKKKMTLALEAELKNHGLRVITADEDADIDIVMTAIDQLESSSNVTVVGSDTDLIILLIALCPEGKNMYFQKEKSSGTFLTIIYKIEYLIEKYKSYRQLLLFTHALTGCDTTSCFYGIGKIKAMEMLQSTDIQIYARAFLDANASKKDLLAAGERFVLCLYGLRQHSTLNEARYYRFLTLTRKSSLKSNFDLAKLPPTSEACHQHLFRVYLQVHMWLGNKLPATEWGWKMETILHNGNLKKTLKPITTLKTFAPDDVLHQMSCACKTGCGSYCGCRKANLTCSPMCEHCSGLSCSNSSTYFEEEIADSSLTCTNCK